MAKKRIKIKFKTVSVYEHEVAIDVEESETWRYKGHHPLLTEHDKDQMAAQMKFDKYVQLHHSHWRKLQKSGFVGWFDFRFGKPKNIKPKEVVKITDWRIPWDR